MRFGLILVALAGLTNGYKLKEQQDIRVEL